MNDLAAKHLDEAGVGRSRQLFRAFSRERGKSRPDKDPELPRALQEWRGVSGDRAISIASDGAVTLLRCDRDGKRRATFPSLDAAAAAVEPPIA